MVYKSAAKILLFFQLCKKIIKIVVYSGEKLYLCTQSVFILKFQIT